MIRKKSFFNIFLILILFMIFIGCSSSNTGTAQVTINLGFPSDTSENGKNRLETRAPANIESLTLTVTGSDMDTIESTHTSDTATITLEVLAGTEREFILSASVGPSDPGIVLSYRGSTTSDLVAGEPVSLTIAMAIYETKLVIPDYNTNNRLIQIDDITGTNWIDNNGQYYDYTNNSDFWPYDVDYDSLGRIYIVNLNNLVGGVIRIDNINYTPYDPIVNLNLTSTIAIDRKSNIIYYATSTQLYQCNLDGSGQTSLGVGAIQIINGLAIDENGILYIAGEDTGGANRLFRYDPSSQTVTNTYLGSLTDAKDVMIKKSNGIEYLFVANYEYNRTSNNKIIRLSVDFSNPIELIYNPSNPPDTFYGPHRFVAILNRKIFVIDDGRNPSGTPSYNNDRIVSIDNITGDNWTPYGSYGSGNDQFEFYLHYDC